jgi:splicing factor 3B subunit 2
VDCYVRLVQLQRRMKIAELKQQCLKPDVVEVWDATAADPRLLVFLKGYRNTVPVPRHWCQKRKFLQDAVHGRV